MATDMPAGTRVRILRGKPELIGKTATVFKEWPMQVALEYEDGTGNCALFSKGGLEIVEDELQARADAIYTGDRAEEINRGEARDS